MKLDRSQNGETMRQWLAGSDPARARRPFFRTAPRHIAHVLIRAYQLSLSAFLGRHCRFLPTCSDYTDAAIARHGLWAGGCLGAARLCRCHPWGGSGYDPVPEQLPPGAHWALPWRYAHRSRPHCDAGDPQD